MSAPATDEPPTLILGLGNPGEEYSLHRHNIGFRVVDALAARHSVSFSRRKKLRARVAEGTIGGKPVVLAKPQTFMNRSGRAAARLVGAFHIPFDEALVIYDDLDLPLGRLRLRPVGGSGGHKGISSIISALGTQGFARLRLGIGRPPGKMEPADYVLLPFEQEELPLLTAVLETAAAAVECWLADGITAAMDRYNGPPVAEQAEAEPGAHGEESE